MPLFSIIIPVYNTERYIGDCIESVLQQRFSDWELILVDDGSKDGSAKLCDKYAQKDERITVIHKQNEGVSVARKTGCDKSRGEYLLFVDADDWIEKNCLQGVADVVSEYHAEIIRFQAYDVYSDAKHKRDNEYHGFYDKKKIKEEIFPVLIHSAECRYFIPSIWGGAFLRQIITPYMIADCRANIGEDSACTIPAYCKAESIFFMEEYYYNYRITDDSLTNGKKVFNWDTPELVGKHLEKYVSMDSYDFREQLYRRVVHDLFNVCVTQYYGNKSFLKTNKDIAKILNRQYYANAIKKASFNGAKSQIMKKALKYRLYPLIFLYSTRWK